MSKYLAVIILSFCLQLSARAQEHSIVTAKDSSAHGTHISVTGDSVKPEKKSFLNTWNFGINGGYGYRLPNRGTRTSDPYSRYLKKLKTGYSIGADVHRFVWPNIGLGLKYNMYKSKGHYDNKNEDNITIQFIGPSVVYQYPFANNTTSVLAGFAMGYQSYSNKGMAVGQDFKTKGNATGWAVSVGIAQKISSHLAINVTGACYLGTSYKFRKQTGGVTETIKLSNEKFENLSRAEVTVGLNFF